MSSNQEKLQKIINNAQKMRKRLVEDIENAIMPAFQDVFDECPQLHSAHWTQYTPYFNDGEPCEFSVCADFKWDDSLYFVDDEGETYVPEMSDWGGKVPDRAAVAAADSLSAIIDGIASVDDSILQLAYGDHVRVTLSKDEDGNVQLEVEDYDHD